MINDVNVTQGRVVAGSNISTTQTSTPNMVQPSNNKPAASSALSGAIEHMVQQGVPIDLDRIIAVRNAIADGQYPVDPMKIAQKITEFGQGIGEK